MNYKNWQEATDAHNCALDLLRQSSTDEALDTFRGLAEQVPSFGRLNSYGTALGMNNNWELALEAYENSLKYVPPHSQNTLVGVAFWCLGKQEEACQTWYTEIEAIKTYRHITADAAGGVTPAALLWWASSHESLTSWRKIASTALKSKAHTKQAQRSWPGPIAFYLLNLMSLDETLNRITLSNHGEIYHRMQLQFYHAARKLDQNDIAGYREIISSIAESPIPVVIAEEYLLARNEYQKWTSSER